jgi:hypothetical protein
MAGSEAGEPAELVVCAVRAEAVANKATVHSTLMLPKFFILSLQVCLPCQLPVSWIRNLFTALNQQRFDAQKSKHRHI